MSKISSDIYYHENKTKNKKVCERYQNQKEKKATIWL